MAAPVLETRATIFSRRKRHWKLIRSAQVSHVICAIMCFALDPLLILNPQVDKNSGE